MTVFGLLHVKDTPMGDPAIRQSERERGQKKCVSIAEVLAGRTPHTASTALEFVGALRIATEIGRLSTIMPIYQASELFDKVCVIDAGRIVYLGPADHARGYFEDMGYVPANRQTTADYLVAVFLHGAPDLFGTTLPDYLPRAPFSCITIHAVRRCLKPITSDKKMR
ncbi:hypothetical protein FIBSPDRAFT_957352 [Athelia psychrophila]|uniref:ABC transporter family G domain-containing protein n=1 Tax=Athelia psychrophila TaxID=1759441 RepID=A0A166FUF7_9AGAM|nr:hypothetical protein FIBSPDRAFT_957352 [Fibularhizoctonia sp. CBS 109695]